MKYKVALTDKAKTQLKKIDKHTTSSLIIRLAKKEYRRL